MKFTINTKARIMKRCIWFAAAALCAAGCSNTEPQRTAYDRDRQPATEEGRRSDFVGHRGAEGPTGQAGARGRAGRPGDPGYAMTGPRGQEGVAGARGEHGPTGARGAPGAVVSGRSGVVGPSGPTGERGQAGPAGARGASAAGHSGPTGPAGPEGAQGPVGPTGVRGPTLVGPTGPAGRPGPEGARGIAGETGPQGSTMAGVAGPDGRSGPAGDRGPAGPTGDQGPAGVIDRWVSYRDFMFEYDRAEIRPSETGMVVEIAAYLKQNPSLQVGIDGTMDPRGTDPRNQGLCDRRVHAVRDALRQAGVPNDKISIGAFGDAQLRRDRRVEVLISTGSASVGATRVNEFTMARRWQKATDLTGKKVVNPANESLGKIEGLVVDAHSGRILFAVVSFGALPDMGERLFAIPWSAMRISDDNNVFVLNTDRDRLRNATGFDKGQWPNFADDQVATATYRYYDQTPYWPAQRDDADRRATHYRDRWNQRSVAWQKTSDLSRMDVRNAQNQDLGKLSDLAIDPESGRILYGVLSSNGKLFAVPWNALELASDARYLVLNIDNQQLNDSVSFRKDNWPSIVDERWGTETHAHYNVEPYWTKRVIEGHSAISR